MAVGVILGSHRFFFMIPDPIFVKKLKEIDKGLNVVWSPTLNIFCVYYSIPDGRTFKVLEVREDDGSFRPLDDRTIDKLRRWDSSKNASSASEIAQQQYNDFYERTKRKVQSRRDEKRYKGKQLVGFWKRAAEMLYDRKLYSEKPLKPLIIKKLQQEKLLNERTAALLNKFGLPRLTGKAHIVNP